MNNKLCRNWLIVKIEQYDWLYFQKTLENHSSIKKMILSRKLFDISRQFYQNQNCTKHSQLNYRKKIKEQL